MVQICMQCRMRSDLIQTVCVELNGRIGCFTGSCSAASPEMVFVELQRFQWLGSKENNCVSIEIFPQTTTWYMVLKYFIQAFVTTHIFDLFKE